MGMDRILVHLVHLVLGRQAPPAAQQFQLQRPSIHGATDGHSPEVKKNLSV